MCITIVYHISVSALEKLGRHEVLRAPAGPRPARDHLVGYMCIYIYIYIYIYMYRERERDIHIHTYREKYVIHYLYIYIYV